MEAQQYCTYFDVDYTFKDVDGFEISMTLEQARSVSGSGRQDDNVRDLLLHDNIIEQLGQVSDRRLQGVLYSCGAWDEKELESRSDNEGRLIWQAGCNIAEAYIQGEYDIICPDCDEIIWDVAKNSKLNKCWDCGLAFD